MLRIRTRSPLLASVSVIFATALCAADSPSLRPAIDAIVQREYPSLEQLYISIHRNPELSMQETQTAARLVAEFRALGFDVTPGFGGPGFVAVMKNGSGKTLLIRTDLDALPVKEETGAEYASVMKRTDRQGREVSVMHACGHDIHMTTIIGTARAMVAMKAGWRGTLIFIGQPAEETGEGAAGMIKAGLFTHFPRPDWCLALHVDHELESGKVGWVSGYTMANVDSVDVVIRGIGGHGAQPQATKDPIVISAQTILAFQTIASRETHPRDPVVVTVGSIHGGTKHNIIPDEVKLQLTVRTYKDETRKRVLEAIKRMARGIAIAAGVPEDREPIVTMTEYTPALYNTPELVQRMKAVLERTMGTENVSEREPSMGGEDFGRYGREEPKIPIFMFRLGSVEPQKVASAKETGVALPSLHSSKYLPDRKSTLQTGITALTAESLDLLQKN